VKQLVEIFIKRSELMPSDESVEQHQKRRAEETGDVDRDRNSPKGLFKGAFPPPSRDLIFDEQDGVLRCPHCLTEHEGGPTCQTCFLPVENGYEFSDMDPDDVDDLELDLDLEDEFAGHHHHHFLEIPHFGFQHFHHQHLYHHGESVTSNSDSSHFNEDSDVDDEDNEDEDEEEDEDDDSSLRDFVVPDDDDPGSVSRRESTNNPRRRRPITISDDESDEGGVISDRRPRRAGRAVGNPGSARHSVVELSSSDHGDLNEEAMVLRDAGWSPLSQENDSDIEEAVPRRYIYGADTEDEDGSDTETIGNRDSYDEDDRSRNESSATPQYEYARYYGGPSYESEGEDEDEGTSEAGQSKATDLDGDTEMSASPGASRTSRSVSLDTDEGYGYGTPTPGSRSASVSTGYGYDAGENLGDTNQMYEVGEDSSDSSIRPPPRRIPRRQQQNIRVQQYDPRISMIFAEHQQSMRGVQGRQENPSELDDEALRVEPASRTRRMAAYRYRLQPPRRADPLRRSPSATRIISSPNRNTRLPRQYQRRN
jgi:hypothetical protein